MTPFEFRNRGILGDEVPEKGTYICRRVSEGRPHTPGKDGTCEDCKATVHMSDVDRDARTITILCLQCAAKRLGLTVEQMVAEARDQFTRAVAKSRRMHAG